MINNANDERLGLLARINDVGKQLRLGNLADILSAQEELPDMLSMPFLPRFLETLNTVVKVREEHKLARLIKTSGVGDASIDLSRLTYEKERNLNRDLINNLNTCHWITNARPNWITVTGKTGVGKSYLIKALVNHSNRKLHKALYIRYNELLEQLDDKLSHNCATEYRNRLNQYDLLAIDDIGMCNRSDNVFQELLALLDARFEHKALILGSQLPVSQWYDCFGNVATVKDGISDRIASRYTIKIELRGQSLRSPRSHLKKSNKEE